MLEAPGVNRSQAIALPIEYGGALVGSCSFVFERDRAFDPDEVELFALTLVLGQAIENARLFEAELTASRGEAERAMRLAVLKELADAASSSLDSHTVASAIVDTLCQLLGAEQVQIRLASEDGTVLESVAAVDPLGMLERLGRLPRARTPRQRSAFARKS